MTKILIDRATAEQALKALKEFGYHGSSPRWERTANDLKAALEQQPVQEPTPWRDMVVVSLVREGINKHKARELADHFAAQPVQEPVGEVVEVNNDGFRCEFNRRLAVGTKLYTFPPAAQPVQEPVACRFCFSKKGCWTWQCYKCGEIDDVQKPAPSQQQAGSVSMRMPKVGDKVICLEDESLGTVVSLTAGGSPDIRFDDGSHGTYLLREFAELFGYAEQRQPLTKDEALTLEALKYAASKGDGRIVREMKIAPFVIKDETPEPPQYSFKAHWTDDKRIGVVACVTRPDGGVHLMQTIIDLPPAQPEQEPVAWDKPSASFDEWWDGDRRRDTANPFDTDSFAYWAFEGWQAALAQRPWQGLTEEEIAVIGDKVANEDLVGLVSNFRVRFTRAIEAAHRIKDSHD